MPADNRALPRRDRLARAAGSLYFLAVIAAALAETLLKGSLLMVGGLVAVLLYVVVTVLFYRIFGPIHRGVAALAVGLNFAGLGLEAAQLSIHGVDVAVVLHGAYCLAMGYLVFRSGVIPRPIGLLMMAASFGWATYLSPGAAQQLSPYNLILGVAGEALACLWLLFRGAGPRAAASRDGIQS